METSNETITRRVDLDISIDALWDTIADPELLATWLGDSVDIDVRPGGAGVVVDDGVTKHLLVDVVVERQQLSFTWWEPGEPSTASRVVFAVETTGDDASRLTITETLHDLSQAGHDLSQAGHDLSPAGHDASPAAVARWEVRVLSLWACTVAAALGAVSALDDLFGALSDPTRRALLQRLMKDGPDTATRLAADSPLTRQAVVKHLQALVEAGLASPAREGREVRYTATPAPLASVLAWLTESSGQWDRRVERLRRQLQAGVKAEVSMR